MTAIGRMLRGTAGATLALGLVVATGLASAPADAAPTLQPRHEEWWFTAWDIQNQVWKQTSGQGMTVAVLDSGVNAQLPELRNVMVQGADTRINGSGNGWTDVDEAGGHGTAMAALIAGQGGPSGMVGIAPDAKILPIVVADAPVADGEPASAQPSAIDVGIRFAADHGAQVIDVSEMAPYPGGCTDTDQVAVSYAIDKGAVVVAAAGDTGNAAEINTPQVPASCAGVLAVGAVNNQKIAWPKTQRQDYVSTSAPGVGIDLVMSDGTLNNNNPSGTGQAATLAAGAVALIRSKFPQLSPREVVQRILNTTVDAGPPGPDNMTGTGVIVPILTLTKDVPQNAPNPTFDRLDAWRAQNSSSAPTPSTTPSTKSPAQGLRSPGSSSGSGMWLLISGIAAVVLAAIIAVAVVLLVTRRRRVAPPRPQPFPGGPPPYYQGPQVPYSGPQPPPGGQWHAPPPGGQGPPPSGPPPNNPWGPPR